MVKNQLSADTFLRRRYRLYARSYGFSILILLIFTVAVPPARAALAAVLAVLSAVYLLRLWVWGAPLRIGLSRLPHAVTAIRGAAASGVLTLVAVFHFYHIALTVPERWVLLGLFTLIEATDLIDGILARRLLKANAHINGNGGQAGTSFGSIWDMECDAAFVLALSAASWLWAGMPPAVLCIGAMRYLYASVLNRPFGPANPPRLYMRFAKTTAAAAALALLLSFVPGLSPLLRTSVMWIALSALTVSFIWDRLINSE